MSENEDNLKLANGAAAADGGAGDESISTTQDDDTLDEGYATLEKSTSNGTVTAGDEETRATPVPTPKARKVSLTSSTMDTDDRRSDEPTKLSFDKGE